MHGVTIKIDENKFKINNNNNNIGSRVSLVCVVPAPGSGRSGVRFPKDDIFLFFQTSGLYWTLSINGARGLVLLY